MNRRHETLVIRLTIPLALNQPQDGTRKLGVLALYREGKRLTFIAQVRAG